MSILIADSGGTKTTWAYQNEIYESVGLNPNAITENDIENHIENEIKIKFPNAKEIYFYGAGCATSNNQNLLKNIFQKYFSDAKIVIENDLIGVAKATCGDTKGNIAIIGTGSNLAYFDGQKLYGEEFNLGYILGDEGSGAYLGKILFVDFLHQKLPSIIHQKLLEKYPDLDRNYIIEYVYKQKTPNRFLAEFTYFLHENIENEYISALIYRSFDTFLSIYLPLLPTESQNFPLHFVGSVAYYFQDILKNVVKKHHYLVGNIAQSPMEGLKKYHSFYQNPD